MMKSEFIQDRRQFLQMLTAVSAAIPLNHCKRGNVSSGSETEKSRNIIFILSDDHRYDFMGFMGRPAFLKTPSLDRLASQGAHLKNAFVTTALCSPSRASILTGQYSHRHGVVDNSAPVPAGTFFFPQLLRDAGYETAFMGKWHMGNQNDEPRPGFDKWISFRGQGQYYDPVINIDGKRLKKEGYITDILTDAAVEWISQDREKPFFLYLSHKAVHAMFEPAKRHLGIYDKAELIYPESMADTPENYRDKPAWVKNQRNSWHGVDYLYHGGMDLDTFYRRYCETLLGVDESVGRVLAALEKLSLLESTLVIYMGDNGFCFGEHGLIDKRQMYEESMRVPMLAFCPELIRSGTVISEMVQNIDIAPTLLEAAGLEPKSTMDGKSFLPLLKGNHVPWRDAVFYEYYWERSFPQTPTVHGIRTGKYKYMHYHGIWDIDELYDVETDPNEMKNLIQDPAYGDLIKELNGRVFKWLEDTEGMLIPLRRDPASQSADRRPESK